MNKMDDYLMEKLAEVVEGMNEVVNDVSNAVGELVEELNDDANSSLPSYVEDDTAALREIKDKLYEIYKHYPAWKQFMGA